MGLIRRLFFFILLLAGAYTFGQQQAQFSQYIVNEFLVNPALSGSEDFIDIKAGYRSQWAGFGDFAPKTFYLSGHTTLGKSHFKRTKKNDYHNWHGAGGLFQSDNTGLASSTSGYINYSYNFQITPGTGYNRNHKDGVRMSVGTFLGFNQFSIDGSQLDPEETDDDAITTNLEQTTTLPDGSIGAMLYYQDQFFIGVSVFNIFGSRIRFSGLGQDVNSDINTTGRLARHYFISGAYKA